MRIIVIDGQGGGLGGQHADGRSQEGSEEERQELAQGDSVVRHGYTAFPLSCRPHRAAS